jgi:hypothetical protein
MRRSSRKGGFSDRDHTPISITIAPEPRSEALGAILRSRPVVELALTSIDTLAVLHVEELDFRFALWR